MLKKKGQKSEAKKDSTVAKNVGGTKVSAAEESSSSQLSKATQTENKGKLLWPVASGKGRSSEEEERKRREKSKPIFEIEKELSELERESVELLKGGGSKHNKLPRFLIQDNANILAVQLTHVSRAIFNMIFFHTEKLYMAYMIYYALSVIFALFVAIVGTIYSHKCDVTVILFLTLYGYLNVLDCALTSALYQLHCELVVILNLVVGLLNHILLFYGVLVMFNGFEVKEVPGDICDRFAWKLAGGLLGFLGVVTIATLLLIYGSFIAIIGTAWRAKVDRLNLIEERRKVLQGEITRIYV